MERNHAIRVIGAAIAAVGTLVWVLGAAMPGSPSASHPLALASTASSHAASKATGRETARLYTMSRTSIAYRPLAAPVVGCRVGPHATSPAPALPLSCILAPLPLVKGASCVELVAGSAVPSCAGHTRACAAPQGTILIGQPSPQAKACVTPGVILVGQRHGRGK